MTNKAKDNKQFERLHKTCVLTKERVLQLVMRRTTDSVYWHKGHQFRVLWNIFSWQTLPRLLNVLALVSERDNEIFHSCFISSLI